jgi:hypothetical protein
LTTDAQVLTQPPAAEIFLHIRVIMAIVLGMSITRLPTGVVYEASWILRLFHTLR